MSAEFKIGDRVVFRPSAENLAFRDKHFGNQTYFTVTELFLETGVVELDYGRTVGASRLRHARWPHHHIHGVTPRTPPTPSATVAQEITEYKAKRGKRTVLPSDAEADDEPLGTVHIHIHVTGDNNAFNFA